MKRKYEIDAAQFTSREEAHAVMQRELDGFEYYGSNLDALHDVLTAIGRDIKITVRNLEKAKEYIGEYADGIKTVFRDSAMQNPHLTAIFIDEFKQEK